jgi:serine/threonine protein kinase/Tfp pilus assembly protein PilF
MNCPKCNFINPSDARFCGNCGVPLRPSQKVSLTLTETLRASLEGLSPGSTFAGRYRILEELGKGGMGVVYKAEDTRLRRTVALKLLPAELTRDEEARRRLVQEAQAAATLDHPHLCTVYEIDETEGKTFISMAYVEGESLRKKIEKGPLDLAEALDIGIQVAEGLDEAHRKGIIHRDIKSSNIMVTDKGKAKIMDFGLAKIPHGMLETKEGTTMGTVAYMSPEQAKGKKVDHRTDVWSLGVVIYEMMSGRLPFKGERNEAVLYSILNDQPPPLTALRSDVPMGLETICGKALEKDATERYQHVDEMLVDLRSIKKRFDSGTLKASPLALRVSKTKRKRFYFLAAMAPIVLFLAIGGFYLLHNIKQRRATAGDKPEKMGLVPQAQLQLSIAVLPFGNLSEDKSNEYFSDGITETIIANLAAIKGLSVRSRTSIVQYKGTSKDLREIGKELNVTHILEGSVIQSGSRVRILAQLIDAQADKHLWAQTYDRDLKDIFEIQSEVSNQIANTLKVSLTPGVQAHLERRPTTNLQAYDYYLQGKFYSYRTTLGDIDLALRMFERAIALDPAFAQAYAGLALTCIKRDFYFEPGRGWDKKALQAAEKALALDSNLAEGYVARGNLYWTLANRFPHEKAIREYRRALELNPNLEEAHLYLGRVYMHIGLLDEAIFEFKKALELDPTSFGAENRLGLTFHYQGKYREAVSIMERLKKEGRLTNDWELAMALFALGEKEKPALLIEKTFRELPEDSDVLSTRAVIFASEGKEAQAEEMIRLAVEKGKEMGHFHHPEYNMGLAYALLKKNARAIEWLKRAAEDGLPCYPLFLSDPSLKNLRSDPRFISFLDKLKRQWEEYKAKFSGPQFPE